MALTACPLTISAPIPLRASGERPGRQGQRLSGCPLSLALQVARLLGKGAGFADHTMDTFCQAHVSWGRVALMTALRLFPPSLRMHLRNKRSAHYSSECSRQVGGGPPGNTRTPPAKSCLDCPGLGLRPLWNPGQATCRVLAFRPQADRWVESWLCSPQVLKCGEVLPGHQSMVSSVIAVLDGTAVPCRPLLSVVSRGPAMWVFAALNKPPSSSPALQTLFPR